MTHYETMDLVLDVFVNKRKSLTLQDIIDGVAEVSEGQIRGIVPIVEQLREDDYLKLDFEDIETEPYEEDIRIGWYSLKSKGKAFSEAGGYAGLKKLKDEERILSRKTVVLTRWIVVCTIVASLFQILDVWYKLYPFSRSETDTIQVIFNPLHLLPLRQLPQLLAMT